jgi:hypothetical protein
MLPGSLEYLLAKPSRKLERTITARGVTASRAIKSEAVAVEEPDTLVLLLVLLLLLLLLDAGRLSVVNPPWGKTVCRLLGRS